MDMLSRYLYAVYNDLPKASQRDDIIAEIAEALQTQIDERESALGRPLTADEEAALIKAYGHPRIVAARYGKHQALIGADLLPFYWCTLVCVLSVIIALDLFVATVAAIKTGDIVRFWDGAGVAWDALWIYTGVITVVFALLERVPGGSASPWIAWITRWDPRRLPAAGATEVPRRASFFEALGTAGMLVLLLDQGWARHFVLFTFTDAWLPLYIVAIAGTAILALVNLTTLVVPLWRRLRDVTHLAVNAALAVACTLTLRGGPVILFQPRLNQIAIAALVIGVVAFACAAAFNLRALLRSRRVTNAVVRFDP